MGNKQVTRGGFAKFIGRSFFKLTGWRAVGEIPDVPHAVFVAYPHTANIDGLWMVASTYAIGFKMSWLGKNTLFRFPFKSILSFFGGVPVDRSSRNNTVNSIADEFEVRDGMYLAIAPAGTRKRSEYWKTGFYHIAMKAGVPLVCGCVDYKKKEAGIIGMMMPTGDMDKDMESLKKLYEGREGKYREKMTPIVFKEKKE